MKATKGYITCRSIFGNPALLAAAKEYTGKYELNGNWEEYTFLGTRPAVDKLEAFCDGWNARTEKG